MRILNEENVEIQESDVDTNLGYLVPDKILKEHHDAIEAQPAVTHYYPTTYYMVDGTEYKTTLGLFREEEEKRQVYSPEKISTSNDVQDYENDPRVVKSDNTSLFGYKTDDGTVEYAGGSVVKGIVVDTIIDTPAVKAQEAWDEYEDIQRYKLYTEEQLAEKKKQEEAAKKQQEFFTTGPDRLSTAESDIVDVNIILAEMIGA